MATIYESEDNNLRTNADTISTGDTVYGKISATNDVDCYKVIFAHTGIVKFYLTIPSDTNYRMRIFINDNSTPEGQDIRTTYDGYRNVEIDVITGCTYCIIISPQTSGVFNANVYYTLSVNYKSNTLQFPARQCNWNQFYTEITNAIGSTAGCSITCGLDIANFYGPDSYRIAALKSHWDTEDGYDWYIPNGIIYGESYSRPSGYNDTQRFNKIHVEIDMGRPVIIKLYGPSSYHFVVAYGYVNGGAATEDIKVFDPATDNTTSSYGRDTTLANAINFSSKTGMDALRCTNN